MSAATDSLVQSVLPHGWAASAGAPGKSCHLTFEGALYNSRELAEICGGRPDESDAALVLRAYQRFGECFVPRIKGIFALVLRDPERGLVLAARDPLGVYPLFYADDAQRLLFSTSISALAGCPDVSPAINRAALAESLSRRWPPSDETFFTAVKRVPPGHVLRQHDGRIRVSRYWDPGPPDSPVEWLREQDLEQFDHLLDQAVSRCLCFGTAGIFLSGGLDSVSIAAIAAQQSVDLSVLSPRALSLAFPHAECNEELIQAAVAEQLGLPIDLIPFAGAIGNSGFMEAAMSASARLSAPLQNVWLPAYMYLARRAVAAGCRVILTGNGGDEWLTVTPRYAADLLRQLDLAGVFRLWRGIQRSYSLPLLPGLRNVLWTNGMRPLLGAGAANLLRAAAPQILRQRRLLRLSRTAPDWIAPDPALRSELQRRAEKRVDEELRAPAMNWYWQDVRQLLDHPLMTMEMEEVFEYSGRLGIRILHPYWDADLVTFLYRTPPHLLNRGERSKGLVRHSLARRFPKLGFERQRKVNSIRFFESQVLDSGAAAWRSLSGTLRLAGVGIVDGERVRRDVETLLAERATHGVERIWGIMNLEAWLRSHVERRSYE